MKTHPSLRFVLVSLALCFAAAAVIVAPSLTGARQAYAGAVHVRDEAHALSADDVARLRSIVAPAPFDARIAVTSEYPDAQDLSRYAGSLVNEPKMIVVALDPQHRHVQVHFGTGVGIARSEWPAIEQAGTPAFRRGDWEGGVAAIFREASRVAADGATGSGAVPAGEARPSLIGPGVLLLIVAGAIGIAIYFARRRSAQFGPYGNTGGYGAGGPFAGPGPGYPGYPGAPPQGGMGPLGGGLIGAGLGGLAGYELGKLEGERERRDVVREEGSSGGGDPGGNFDAGGGGSGWDDGGGDTGGGGGFDGGDSGGGGSDF
jgi:hypothetical protein